MIKVLLCGVHGKMGQVTAAALTEAADLELVAGVGSQDDLAAALETHRPDVAIDFTTPAAVYANATTLIAHDVRPVIGATGMSPAEIDVLTQQCAARQLGGIIAPNFSLAAILMMRAARDIAMYLPHCEIIEMHHPFKKDAPSGTARKTAQMMVQANAAVQQSSDDFPARGDFTDGVPIHSVRLPGLFAHQMVMFGNDGETLTLRYDGMDRGCCMPGVLLACRQVMTLNKLIYGLEQLI